MLFLFKFHEYKNLKCVVNLFNECFPGGIFLHVPTGVLIYEDWSSDGFCRMTEAGDVLLLFSEEEKTLLDVDENLIFSICDEIYEMVRIYYQVATDILKNDLEWRDVIDIEKIKRPLWII